MSYHNTTETTGPDLQEYEAKAIGQEDLILDYFNNTTSGHTPSHIQSVLLPRSPITSVRRAITNLTNAGKLVKTDTQCNGPFNRPEFVWKGVSIQKELF